MVLKRRRWKEVKPPGHSCASYVRHQSEVRVTSVTGMISAIGDWSPIARPWFTESCSIQIQGGMMPATKQLTAANSTNAPSLKPVILGDCVCMIGERGRSAPLLDTVKNKQQKGVR